MWFAPLLTAVGNDSTVLPLAMASLPRSSSFPRSLQLCGGTLGGGLALCRCSDHHRTVGYLWLGFLGHGLDELLKPLPSRTTPATDQDRLQSDSLSQPLGTPPPAGAQGHPFAWSSAWNQSGGFGQGQIFACST